MADKQSIVKQAKDQLNGLTQAKADLGGDLSNATLAAKAKTVQDQVDVLAALKKQQTQAVNDKRAATRDLRQIVTRIRSGIRSKYGPDSTEYELVGGVRTSERKKPQRKPKA